MIRGEMCKNTLGSKSIKLIPVKSSVGNQA
jgi:hypothetical protein